jgi:hypothetical protein
MRRFVVVIACLLGLSASAGAQSVTLPAEVKGAKGAWIAVVPSKVDGGPLKWRWDKNLQEVDLGDLLPKDGERRTKVFVSQVEGKFKVEAWCAKDSKASDIAVTWVIVGNGTEPKVKPKPDVKPDGPGPKVDKPDAPPKATSPPIAGPGFKVLIVYEIKRKADVVNIIQAAKVLAYLRANCAVGGPGGRTPEYRILAQTTDMSTAEKEWQDAMKRPRASLPWIIISNGTNGVTSYEGPLPGSADDTVALLKKVKEGTLPPQPIQDTPIVTPTEIDARIAWWRQNYPDYTSKP